MSRSQRQRENRELVERLRRDAELIARRFGLRYRVIESERANVKRRYGICYSDGTIRIRLRHASTGRPLRYSSLVNTLCHELAHLRHFDHGERFKRFYLQLLGWARQEAIYRPELVRSGRVPAPAPGMPRPAAAGPYAGRGIPPRPWAPRRPLPAPAEASETEAPDPAPKQLSLF